MKDEMGDVAMTKTVMAEMFSFSPGWQQRGRRETDGALFCSQPEIAKTAGLVLALGWRLFHIQRLVDRTSAAASRLLRSGQKFCRVRETTQNPLNGETWRSEED